MVHQHAAGQVSAVIHLKLHVMWKRTSSSAMADRPCDCLCPKSSLCSCQHCQWFCAGTARHQRWHSYSPGKKNQDQLAGLAQQLE